MTLNATAPIEGIVVIAIGKYDPKASREKTDIGRRSAYELQNQLRAKHGRLANIRVNYMHGNVEGIIYQIRDFFRALRAASGVMAEPGESLTPSQIERAAGSFIDEIVQRFPEALEAPASADVP